MVTYYFIGYFNFWDSVTLLWSHPRCYLTFLKSIFFFLHSLSVIISLTVSQYLPSPSLPSCHSSWHLVILHHQCVGSQAIVLALCQAITWESVFYGLGLETACLECSHRTQLIARRATKCGTWWAVWPGKKKWVWWAPKLVTVTIYSKE
jgi:hypothetical protein